mmetsp:Transcript_15024/g.38619  ORF Transcript_15024/g.38619 Transcript_15024/m.38619 type:complete len:240 (-) Transcript_15024:911-1630(-)
MGAILIAMPLPLSLCGGQNAQDAVAVAVLAVRRVSGLRIPPRRGEPLSVATVPDVEVRDAALVGPRLEGGMGALVGVHVARHDDVYTRGHQNPFHGVSVEVALPEMIAVAVVPGHVEQAHNPGCSGPVDAGDILQEPLHLRRFVCERQIGVQHNNMCWPVVSREPKRRRGSRVVVALGEPPKKLVPPVLDLMIPTSVYGRHSGEHKGRHPVGNSAASYCMGINQPPPSPRFKKAPCWPQ